MANAYELKPNGLNVELNLMNSSPMDLTEHSSSSSNISHAPRISNAITDHIGLAKQLVGMHHENEIADPIGLAKQLVGMQYQKQKKYDSVCKLNGCDLCAPDGHLRPLKLMKKGWKQKLVLSFGILQRCTNKTWLSLSKDIYPFFEVDSHWDLLWPSVKKDMYINWRKKLQDSLSHNKDLFESGTHMFGRKGYWKLVNSPSSDLSPPTSDSQMISSSPQDLDKSFGKRELISDEKISRSRKRPKSMEIFPSQLARVDIPTAHSKILSHSFGTFSTPMIVDPPISQSHQSTDNIASSGTSSPFNGRRFSLSAIGNLNLNGDTSSSSSDGDIKKISNPVLLGRSYEADSTLSKDFVLYLKRNEIRNNVFYPN